MKTIMVVLSIVLLVLSNISAQSGDNIIIGGLDGLDPFDQYEKYPVLLALSGGGIRGLASIGVLKAFEEKGITVEAVAGTSIGGIVGGLYACGYSPEDLVSIVNNLDLSGLFSNQPARRTMFLTQREERDRHLVSVRFDGFRPVLPSALTAGQRLTVILTSLTTKATYHAAGDFTKLPIPFKAISTDILTGEEVVLDHGSLADAMRATMGFPLAFTPLEKDERLLMDGGMVMPIPVELVRSMNDTISFTVAVNTSSPLLPREELKNVVDIANQVTSIMTADKLATQLELADYTITPPIDGIGMGDFSNSNMDSLIEIGYRSGLVAADSIIIMHNKKEDSSLISVMQIIFNDSSRTIINTIENHLLGRTMNREQLVAYLKSSLRELDLFRLEARLVTLCSTSVHDREIMLEIEIDPVFTSDETRFEFFGNELYDDSTLAGLLLQDSSVVTSVTLRRGLDRLLECYQQDGYDLTDITNVVIDADTKLVSVSIDEAVIDKVNIEGNNQTKDWFIRSNIPLEKGKPYSTRRASRGLANVYATDLFDRVTIDLISSDNGAVVKIGVEEKQYRQLRLGWHWDDEYQSEEFAEFLDDNVLGAGLQYLLHARYARDRREYFVSFKTDRIFSTYLTAGIRAYHNSLDRNLFDTKGNITGFLEEKRTGAEARFGQQISRLGTVTIGIVGEQVETHERNRVDSRFGLRMFKIESLVETFNRIPFPETGKRHLFELKFAGKYFGGEVEYTRFYSSLEAYWPIGKYFNYHPKLAVGLSRSGLPVTEKFYLGGMRSFAGFRTHQLTGDKILAMSHEFRLKFPLSFYISLYYHTGEVFSSADHIKLSGFRHGLGVIIAYDSLIGPFELAYGTADDGFKRYYINVGLSF